MWKIIEWICFTGLSTAPKEKVLVKNLAGFVMPSTGWLSLETAVKRALKPYIPLKSYFLSLDEPQVRFKKLKNHLKMP